jgi:flagellar L-ring protein precursor FlgH
MTRYQTPFRPARPRATPWTGAVALLLAATALSGCNVLTRLSEVGGGPTTSPVTNPTTQPGYKPVNLPMPAAQPAEINPNSLWRAGARAFFKDIRAKAVGDIITVRVSISNETGKFENKTERARGDSERARIDAFLGLEAELAKRLPQAVDATQLLNFSNNHTTLGDGGIERKETVTLTFAAVITQIMPNGNMVLMGRQELLVNQEIRELVVLGVVRPEDIDSDNTITHEKIAELRMAYGGRGTLSGLQAPRWGAQVWDILFPF